MLTEICEFLRNWFDKNQTKYFGEFTISNGTLTLGGGVITPQSGQYYRIIGSVFNDGVHASTDTLQDEESFEGAVWMMAVPSEVVSLASDISDWCTKYNAPDSEAISPYASESFAGYSYTKGSKTSASSGADSSADGWQAAFSSRLRRWKKL